MVLCCSGFCNLLASLDAETGTQKSLRIKGGNKQTSPSWQVTICSKKLKPLSLYCLVDEVLRRGKIMLNEKKTDISFFFPPTCMKDKGFFQ